MKTLSFTGSVALFGLTLAAGSVARAEGDAGGFAPAAEAAAAFGAGGQLALSLGATADEHFFGPSIRFNLSGPEGTEYGLDSMLGGWF